MANRKGPPVKAKNARRNAWKPIKKLRSGRHLAHLACRRARTSTLRSATEDLVLPGELSPFSGAINRGEYRATEEGPARRIRAGTAGIRHRCRALGPGGKMPPSTAARMAAATSGAVLLDF